MLFEKLGFVGVAVVGASLFFSGSARADEAAAAPPADAAASPPAAEAPAAAAPKTDAKPAPKGEVDDDGVRFRGGISGGGGAMIFAAEGAGLAGTLGVGGVDGRLGVQINDLIGIYAQPQLGIYGGGVGVGGLVGGVAVVDFTFIDQIFVGVGAGGGLLNSPGAAEIIVRAGGYPVFGFGEDNVRRKGLMVGLDLRTFIAPTAGVTIIGISPTVNIGYEAF